jgi:hypothetical protein
VSRNGRLLIYAKATSDVVTNHWLADQVLERVTKGVQGAAAGAPEVIAACAFWNGLLTRQRRGTNPTRDPLPMNPLVWRIAPGAAVSDLLDRQKVAAHNWAEFGKEGSLRDFLDSATGQSPLGKHDALLLWGHGSASAELETPLHVLANIEGRGLRSARATTMADRQTLFASDDHLQPREIAQAIAAGGHRPGLVLFSTCQGGTVEVLDALQGVADYLIASPDTVYPIDWEYEKWIPDVFNGQPFDALRAGRAFVANSRGIANNTKPLVALAHLAAVPSLVAATQAFVTAGLRLDDAERKRAASLIWACEPFYSPQPNYKAFDFAHVIAALHGNGLLERECEGILAALGRIVIDADKTRFPGTFGGISIVFPRGAMVPAPGGGRYLKRGFETVGDKVFNTFSFHTQWKRFCEFLQG